MFLTVMSPRSSPLISRLKRSVSPSSFHVPSPNFHRQECTNSYRLQNAALPELHRHGRHYTSPADSPIRGHPCPRLAPNVQGELPLCSNERGCPPRHPGRASWSPRYQRPRSVRTRYATAKITDHWNAARAPALRRDAPPRCQCPAPRVALCSPAGHRCRHRSLLHPASEGCRGTAPAAHLHLPARRLRPPRRDGHGVLPLKYAVGGRLSNSNTRQCDDGACARGSRASDPPLRSSLLFLHILLRRVVCAAHGLHRACRLPGFGSAVGRHTSQRTVTVYAR